MLLWPDANGDGFVSQSDYGLLGGPWSSPSQCADIYIDGLSDTRDWIAWWNFSWGTGTPPDELWTYGPYDLGLYYTLGDSYWDILYDAGTGRLDLKILTNNSYSHGVMVPVSSQYVQAIHTDWLPAFWHSGSGVEGVQFYVDHLTDLNTRKMPMGLHHIADLTPGLSQEDFGMVFYPNGYEQVKIIPAPGDVNADGYVGGLDLTTIITNWGMTGATRQQGDLDGDGTVSGPDYTGVITYWGTGTPPPELPSGVPEPAALGLMVISGLAILKRK